MSNTPTSFKVGANVSDTISSVFNNVAESPFGNFLKSAFNFSADWAGTGVDYTTGFFSTFMPQDYAKVVASLATLGVASYLASGKGLIGMGIMGMAIAGIMHSSDIIKPDSTMGRFGEFMFGQFEDVYDKYSNNPPNILPQSAPTPGMP